MVFKEPTPFSPLHAFKCNLSDLNNNYLVDEFLYTLSELAYVVYLLQYQSIIELAFEIEP